MFSKNTIIIAVLLFLICCFAVFLTGFLNYSKIYVQGIPMYGDDAMYHMRVLENTLLGKHFPWQMNYDVFTNFPHGTYTNIAPAFNFIIGLIIWIVSLGNPTIGIINRIAPFYPVILFALLPIVIYFISKAIWQDRRIAVLSAFLVTIMPAILFKSSLGYDDHHIAEVLFSSVAVMFLLYWLKTKKLVFAILCGIALGIYFLNWTGALIFLFIFSGFAIIAFIVEFLQNKNTNWILLHSAIILAISLAVIAPFFDLSRINDGVYNTSHIICFSLSFSGLAIMWLCGFAVNKYNLKKWFIVILPFVIAVLGILATKFFVPSMYEKLIILVGGVNSNGGLSEGFKDFVSEMKPLRLQGAISNFYPLFFIFISGLFMCIWEYIKSKNLKYILLLVWSFTVFAITGVMPFFGQNRFTVYLSVAVAVMSGWVIVRWFELGFNSLHESSNLDENINHRKSFIITSVFTVFFLVVLLLYPFPFNAGQSGIRNLPMLVQTIIDITSSPIKAGKEQYDLLKWLRQNTPDTGMDFYGQYSQDYVYPKQSYGILAHWDWGHAIVYYSHRPAIANNFQQGIGKIENGQIKEMGEGVFFLETNESKAVNYLDQMRAKYIITDSRLTSANAGFNTLVKLVQGNTDGYTEESKNSLSKYDSSMIARLHLLDGSQTIIEKKSDNNKLVDLTIPALSHFKLVYESPTQVSIVPFKNDNREIKQYKIFEYVKGYSIKGWAVPGSVVNVSTEVITNQNRKFEYKNSGVAGINGAFEIIVPYAGKYKVKTTTYENNNYNTSL